MVHKHFDSNFHGLDNCQIIPIEKIHLSAINSQNLNANEIQKQLTKLRLVREKYWITKLQTTYPFGLNSRVKGIGDFNPSQGFFQNFGGRTRRRNKKHSRRKPKRLRVKHNISIDFINKKHLELSNKNGYVHFFKSFLYGLPRSELQVLLQQAQSQISNVNERVKDMIIMISHMRLFKPTQIDKSVKREFFHLDFINKGLDHINISNILRSFNVTSKIPVYFSDKEPPILGFKFNKNIASILFNYKQTLTTDNLVSVDIVGIDIWEIEIHRERRLSLESGTTLGGWSSI